MPIRIVSDSANSSRIETMQVARIIGEGIATIPKLADRFYYPNNLHKVNDDHAARFIFCFIYYRPKYGSFLIRTALNKLGENYKVVDLKPDPDFPDDPFQIPIKSDRFALADVKMLNFHLKRLSKYKLTKNDVTPKEDQFGTMRVNNGQVGDVVDVTNDYVYEALLDALSRYSELTNDKIPWKILTQNGGFASGVPQVCTFDFYNQRQSIAGRGVTDDEEPSDCAPSPEASPFYEKVKAAVQGWFSDLTSIQYIKDEPAVAKDFAKALAILFSLILLGCLAYHFTIKKRIKSS